MREKIISILSELRPEFDFSEPVNFIEEGMLRYSDAGRYSRHRIRYRH